MVKTIKLGHIDTVNGICPECEEDTRQYINGSIKYLKLEDQDVEWLRKNHP